MKAIIKGTMPQLVSFAVAVLALAGSAPGAAAADDAGWMDLIGDHGLDAWRTPAGAWLVAGDAGIDPKHANRLAPKPGAGALVNGPTGKTQNLLSRQDFQDVEAHFEFLIPKGSNSGVKFEGLYEIQIADSSGVAKPTASHSGGIYPRAEMLPRYHHIDDGVAHAVERGPRSRRMADARRHLPRTAVRLPGPENPERAVRQGCSERSGDSRAS